MPLFDTTKGKDLRSIMLSQSNGVMSPGAQIDPGQSSTMRTSQGEDGGDVTTAGLPGYFNPGSYQFGDTKLHDIFGANTGLGYVTPDYGGGGEDRFGTPEAVATYTDQNDYNNQRSAYYKEQGLDPSQTYLKSDEFSNPLGSSRDFAQNYYKYDPTKNTADPIHTSETYRPSDWISGGRPLVKGTGAMLASYFGGALGGYAASKVLGASNQNEADALKGGSWVGGMANFASSPSMQNMFNSGGTDALTLGNTLKAASLADKTTNFNNTPDRGTTMPTQTANVPNVAQPGAPAQGWTPPGGDTNLEDLIRGGTGLYNANQGYKDQKGLYDNLNSLFSPNSPYAQQMREQLSRRDAGSGRRSQYGSREVELQAALAKNQANLAPQLSNILDRANTSRGQMINQGTNLGQILMGGQNAPRTISDLFKLLQGGSQGYNTIGGGGQMSPEDVQSENASLLNRYPAPQDSSMINPLDSNEFGSSTGSDNYDSFWSEFGG